VRRHWAGHTFLSDRAKLLGSESMMLSSLSDNPGLSSHNVTPVSGTLTEWYAVHTRPRHEKKIAEEIRLRDFEGFLPLHRSRRRWKNGVVADVELPLFPCYLFVNIPLSERVRLLQLPGVIGFAVNSIHPTALAQQDVEALRTMSNLCRVEPHPFLKAGDRVRIVTGPLAGMEGILVRRAHELRVVLSLDFIMRSVAVEVSELDIEPLRHSGRVNSHSAFASTC
jgi:transcription termination/antitermination protein NusG